MMPTNTRKSILLLAVLIGFFSTAIGQRELSLHFMDRVFYRNHTNPALFPESSKLDIGLISPSLRVGNSAFDYKDLIKVRPEDDSLVLDIGNVISKMEDLNSVSSGVRLDIFWLHFKVKKKLDISFGVSERMNVEIQYPKALAELLWYGNSANVGETVEISPRFRALEYRQASFGAAYTFLGDKLTIGGKFNYMIGGISIETLKASSTIYTDPNIYEITMDADVKLQTGGLTPLIDSAGNATDVLINDNRGVGFDFGVVVKPTDRLQIAASVVDIGKISYKENVRNYEIVGEYDFGGFDGLDDVDFEEIIDTLQVIFDPIETEEAFEIKLDPKVYLSAVYDISHTEKIGVMYQANITDDGAKSAFTIMAKKRWRPFDLGVTYSIYNDRANNFGVMSSITVSGFQFFIVTDDIGSLIRYRNSKYVDMRFGIMFRFGKDPWKALEK